jgi:hypothetical protein
LRARRRLPIESQTLNGVLDAVHNHFPIFEAVWARIHSHKAITPYASIIRAHIRLKPTSKIIAETAPDREAFLIAI